MELTITLQDSLQRVSLFGPADANLKVIRDVCDVFITARDSLVTLRGKKPTVEKAANLLQLMQDHLRTHSHITKEQMHRFIIEAATHNGESSQGAIEVYVPGRKIKAITPGQKNYITAIEKNDLVFCSGPAGSGKTYLAVAMAVSFLKQNKIRRIILARPAVEAGEKLGFLPGDLQAKVNPYLRPLFDALGDMMDYAQVKRFMYNDVIEVVPLAFMRGRTLNDAFVILDEAQNTTIAQMLMFLTRLGHDSKMVVTGDDSQVDLPERTQSGIIDAMQRLKGIKGIGFIRLTEIDIVRHRLVQNVVKAYGNNENREIEKLKIKM